MLNPINLRETSTDFTLILAAESIFQANKKLPSDPLKAQCFQTLVDLLINSDTLYVPLPGTAIGEVPLLISKLDGIVKPLYKSAIVLNEDTEIELRKGFVAAIRSHQWIEDWARFQLVSPLVKSTHKDRVESIISAEGLDIWMSHREWFWAELPQGFRFNITLASLSGYELLIKTFGSIDDFCMCYVFDVYRRGWQYLRSSQNTTREINAVYFPHLLRNNALDTVGGWQQLKTSQSLYWSWGAYLLNVLLETDKSANRVMDYILAIRESMSATGCPKWADIVINDGQIDKHSLLEAKELIYETASQAKLPSLKMDDTQIKRFDPVGEVATYMVETIAPVFGIAKIIAKIIFPIVIKQLDAELVEKLDYSTKSATNKLFKGSYGYKGLLQDE